MQTMASDKAVTTVKVRIDAESDVEKKHSVNVFQDTMDEILDERVNLDDIEFEMDNGVADIEFTLDDEPGYRQEAHKEIVDGLVSRVISHPGKGNLVDYRSNRMEIEEDEGGEE